jgi:hypothetical protein
MIAWTPRAAFGAFTLVLSSALATAAFAGAGDYRFELASAQPAGAGKTDIALKLVHAPDGKTITDAVVFESKLDMGPSGMDDMAGKVTPVSPSTDGLYRFTTKTGMAGKWALHVSAKVQGETETVQGTVEFDAK